MTSRKAPDPADDGPDAPSPAGPIREPGAPPGLASGTPQPWAAQREALRDGRGLHSRGAGDVLRMTGADRLDLLHRLSASEVRGARPGSVVATVFTNDKGRLVDVALAAVADDALWILAGEGSGARLQAWLERFVIMEDVQITRDPTCRVQTWIGRADDEPAAGRWRPTPDGQLLLREPRPWERWAHAFPAAVPASTAAQPAHAVPCPLPPALTQVEDAAYAHWCLEVGRLRPGPDLDEALNPWEAGLAPWVSLTKGCFIGQEVVARLANYDRVRRHPVRLLVTGPPPPKGTLLDAGGQAAGLVVTSASRWDGPGSWALAVVRRELQSGAPLELPGGERAVVDAVFGG